IIDGDKGVLVEDCMFISRAIEHNLDREEQDFSLTVTSAGAASPLVLPRQYKKNMGRDIEIITSDSKKVSGKLENISEDSVVLKWKTREPKPVGKGKTTVIKEETISFDNIKEAKVIIKF
ncbi:MAG: ribosome assembly cofactor RimP, partial [Bacteroidia bacterium]|nr:ribosome assembly cofactor RimP [Bacteroidia bacterium]